MEYAYEYRSVSAITAFPIALSSIVFEDPLGEIKEFTRSWPIPVPIITMSELVSCLNYLGTEMNFYPEKAMLLYQSNFPIERTLKINSNLSIEFERLPLVH